MNEFLKEILKNQKAPKDTMYQNHIAGKYTIKCVPCREVKGIGIVYSSKTMDKVLKLLAYMRKNDLEELEFDFTI